MTTNSFHPLVADWFEQAVGEPTAVQAEAWPAIAGGRHTLIAAPTGSGKTLAAFLAVLDDLVRRDQSGDLPEHGVQAVYVTPLKALSNDVHRNLELPLAGIVERAEQQGLPKPGIRAGVRTGDTPRSERDRQRDHPPHVLVTTPESLYLLLTSASGRAMLGDVRSVIVDEIHVLAATKRGAHLALSLERLSALTEAPPTRIGLSATQKPMDEVARFLVGAGHTAADGTPDCTVVDAGHRRALDLAMEVPDSPLEPVMAGEVWEEVYERLASLVREHRTTLVFANARRMVERVARHLGERLGEEAVAAHHGSLSKERRLAAERALKDGEVRVMVATASLELGIDIGDVDLVCQLGSPGHIATFLQRVGRSGHALAATPKGRLFPLSRDDLVTGAALLQAARDGELEALQVPRAPLEVLAQQVTAEVAAAGEWDAAELLALFRRAWPYRDLPRTDFDAVTAWLHQGLDSSRGRRGAVVHRDTVHDRLRPRRGAGITALTCGGTIPDQGDFDVVLEPEGHVVGTLNEDFALETVAGTIFQLGNRAYRFLRVAEGRVRVADAGSQTPGLPFWFGEAPGRSDELSTAVSALRAGVEARLGADHDYGAARAWLEEGYGLPAAAAEQAARYLAAGRAALGALPTSDTLVFERFFDESGGMQLLIHAPLGSRINKAWGLALRKRFCRKFNFELQAAATEDTIVLSLASAHSFPLAEAARYLHPDTVRDLLVQALLDAPLFTTRWRWNATTALAIPRVTNGRRTPPQRQRMLAEDLLSALFPEQIACLENIAGDRDIPDHPLVDQTLHDCLHEALDIAGLERVLAGLHDGSIQLVTADLTGPSPLAQEVLGARPYAFLDNAPAEERRTREVSAGPWLDPHDAAELGRLDPEAIAAVRTEAWPEVRDADELHDALDLLGAVTAGEGTASDWDAFFAALRDEGRAAAVTLADGTRLWASAERLPQLRARHPELTAEPDLPAPPGTGEPEPDAALTELVRGRLEGEPVVTARHLAAVLGASGGEIGAALAALEAEGAVFRGHYSPGAEAEEWCERRLLARIHRTTLDRRRAEVAPVEPAELMRFLLEWQGVADAERQRPEGPQALQAALEQLAGFEAPAPAWERAILPARLPDYDPAWLDQLGMTGRLAWGRLTPPPAARGRGKRAGAPRTAPVAFCGRGELDPLLALAARIPADDQGLSGPAARLAAVLDGQGPQFYDELARASGLLPAQVEAALGELVAYGRAHSDGFAGLRALLVPANRKGGGRRGRRRWAAPALSPADGGRWAALRAAQTGGQPEPDAAAPEAEAAARLLLARYGVVFRALLAREPEWLPPWRILVRALRRLEDRGEARGGRFVAGFSGEQFALPEAVDALRAVHRRGPEGRTVSVDAADPLNLVGILVPGERPAANSGASITYRDGVPVSEETGREPARTRSG